jgi:hypothetical protein
MLTGDGPVVVDQRLDRVGQVDHLGIAVNLHVGTIEFVREHHHTRVSVALHVGRLRALRITRYDNAAHFVYAARHRRALQRPVRAKRGEHHPMARSDEVE